MSNIEVIGMIGVNRERDSSRGVTVSLFGGGINPADEIRHGWWTGLHRRVSQAQ